MIYAKKIFKPIILVLAVIALSSCNNLFENTTETKNNKTTDGNTYLIIKIDDNLSSRTVNPLTDVNELYNLKLTGKRGESNLGATTLATGTSVSDLSSKEIPIAAGVWTFTLTATMNYNSMGTSNFLASTTANIEAGKTNSVSFTLSNNNSSNYGGVYITVNFSDEKNNVNKVVATLKNSDKSETLGTDPFSDTQITNNGSAYEKTIIYKKTIGAYGLQPGSYYLVFEFFAEDENGTDVLLNTLPTYMNIVKGFPSVAEFNIDINEVYPITYEYWFNESSGFTTTELETLSFENGAVLPAAYSKNSPTYILPAPGITGYVFDAWYSNIDFEEEHKITQITKGTTGDLTLYAHFTESTVNTHSSEMIRLEGTDGEEIDTAYWDAEGNTTVGNIYVSKYEITQADYESYMTYENGFVPTETEDLKETYPAYYVSWCEAVIYCNLRSMDEKITPYYSINGETDPTKWTAAGVETSNGKCYLPVSNIIESTQQIAGNNYLWEPTYVNGGGQLKFAENETDSGHYGYRLPCAAEWCYIAAKSEDLGISDLATKNVDEWVQAWDHYGSEVGHYHATGSINGTYRGDTNAYDFTVYDSESNSIPNYAHNGTENIGFRVVRNAP